jgi:hypothetical protein
MNPDSLTPSLETLARRVADAYPVGGSGRQRIFDAALAGQPRLLMRL